MYNKLFSKILDSSIWLEPDSTRIVWMTLLATMDEDGFCAFACAANVANRAIVPLEKAEQALKTLESPDPNSADPENEGRRIERVPGGWVVLNAPKYRELATREKIRESNRKRAQAFRDRKHNAPVTPRNDSSCNQSKSDQSIKTISSKPDGSDWATRAIQALFNYFLELTHKNPKLYMFSAARKSKGLARLDYCYKLAGEPKQEKAVALFRVAIERFASSLFHNGQNQQGKKYLDWELLCRSDEKFAYWLDDQNFLPAGTNKPNGHADRFREVPA